ncbi:MAG TPA: trehalose-phosphatase [Acidimicrobiales bacterium]|nr:trehalose-phosphatase [Acidimicrobiales bacterium]
MTTTRTEAVELLAADPPRTALFVDFDGTLAPIVADPSLSVALPDTVATLRLLAGHLHTVGVVSGRPAAFLLERLGGAGGLRLFGLYGSEAVDDDGRVAETTALSNDPAAIAALVARARAALPADAVEDKGRSLALHWRRHPLLEPTMRGLADELASAAGMRVHEAKMSLELLPAGAPSKGTVVRAVAAGLSCVAFAGDDLGDLAAFDALDELAAAGAGTLRIAVAGPEMPAALAARADLQVEGPAELAALFGELARRLAPAR